MTFNLEFITPTFLCGANQGKAELRAPSLRGELRWWFRALGANAEEERKVFGGLGEPPVASCVMTRVGEIQARHEELPKMPALSGLGYLYYFASVSGEVKGIRVRRDAYFAPGTRFVFSVSERRSISPSSRARLDQALCAFKRLGAVGLRATRGCGAISDVDDVISFDAFMEWANTLTPCGVICKPLSREAYDSWTKCQGALGKRLRDFRKEHKLSAQTSKSALGYSHGKQRQSSALRLRPIRVSEGYVALLVYTDAACREATLAPLL